MAMKCQYRASAYPPSRSASGARLTGFQMAMPVTTIIAAIQGMEK